MGYFLFVIALFLFFLSAIYLLYLSLFYVLHQKRYASKKHAPTYEDQRFAILIPARNEANVIEASLKALHQLDYPKNQYDIYVPVSYTHLFNNSIILSFVKRKYSSIHTISTA